MIAALWIKEYIKIIRKDKLFKWKRRDSPFSKLISNFVAVYLSRQKE